MTVLWIILGALALLIAVLLVRAAMFKPREAAEEKAPPLGMDEEHIVESLARMVRCRTVSSRDNPEAVDQSQFEAFHRLLEERYPLVHRTCTREFVGKNGILYHWKGKTPGDPTVLMAHYDVVPWWRRSGRSLPSPASWRMGCSGAGARWIPRAPSAARWRARNTCWQRGSSRSMTSTSPLAGTRRLRAATPPTSWRCSRSAVSVLAWWWMRAALWWIRCSLESPSPVPSLVWGRRAWRISPCGASAGAAMPQRRPNTARWASWPRPLSTSRTTP